MLCRLVQAAVAVENQAWGPRMGLDTALKRAEDMVKKERRRQRAAKGTGEGAAPSAPVSPDLCAPYQPKRPLSREGVAAGGEASGRDSPSKRLRLEDSPPSRS